jgi:hypothetical protein
MRVLSAVLFILLSCAAVAPGATAQEAPLTKVYACAEVADATARLACYDAAVASLKQAETGGDLAVVSRAQVQQAEKEAFGLSTTPTISKLAEAATTSPPASSATTPASKPQRLDRVVLAIKRIDKTSDGKMLFVMENGQVWRQTDSIKLTGLGKGPWEADVRKAALGSFLLKVDGRTAVRVKRVE